ncbi:hypothetical protein QBC38DRAFT_448375 [Podospora fimiseda]|uniref:Uncharacterized protein n=1 Tax=Podospora fimiseda TaxID=252190 RepID=A0AAN6YPL3_9PEZI|nr:hypothetical protein QBC38DRAFT_448375 [Podospora fimiseda]
MVSNRVYALVALGRFENRDDHNFLSSFDSSDDERRCKIDLAGRTAVVVWEDSTRQMQHTPDLRIDLHVDASEGTAVFALHSCVFLKGGKPNKLKLYLFIYPEDVQSVEYDGSSCPPIPAMQRVPSNNFTSLHFTMTQPPSFVVPKDRPLVPKARSEGLLDTMKALASARDITIYLDALPRVPEIRYHLSLLPSVFLFVELRRDERRVAIQRLYHGAGGQVISLDHVAPAASPTPSNNTSIKETVEEESPPPYLENSPVIIPAQLFTPPPNRKRRRTSELLSPSTTDKHTWFAFNQVLKRKTEIESRLEWLEKMVQESLARTPCRYNTEEMEHIINHVDDRVDDQLTGVQVELEDKVMDGTEELVLEKVLEKTEETHEQLLNGIKEDFAAAMEEMREEIMRELRKDVVKEDIIRDLKEEIKQELMAEMKAEFFRDMAQAMMSAASGGNEKAMMAVGAGSQASQSTK